MTSNKSQEVYDIYSDDKIKKVIILNDSLNFNQNLNEKNKIQMEINSKRDNLDFLFKKIKIEKLNTFQSRDNINMDFYKEKSFLLDEKYKGGINLQNPKKFNCKEDNYDEHKREEEFLLENESNNKETIIDEVFSNLLKKLKAKRDKKSDLNKFTDLHSNNLINKEIFQFYNIVVNKNLNLLHGSNLILNNNDKSNAINNFFQQTPYSFQNKIIGNEINYNNNNLIKNESNQINDIKDNRDWCKSYNLPVLINKIEEGNSINNLGITNYRNFTTNYLSKIIKNNNNLKVNDKPLNKFKSTNKYENIVKKLKETIYYGHVNDSNKKNKVNNNKIWKSHIYENQNFYNSSFLNENKKNNSNDNSHKLFYNFQKNYKNKEKETIKNYLYNSPSEITTDFTSYVSPKNSLTNISKKCLFEKENILFCKNGIII